MPITASDAQAARTIAFRAGAALREELLANLTFANFWEVFQLVVDAVIAGLRGDDPPDDLM